MDEMEIKLKRGEPSGEVLKQLERLVDDLSQEFKIDNPNVFKIVYKPMFMMFRIDIKVTPNRKISTILNHGELSLSYFIPEDYQKLKERTVKELYKELNKALTEKDRHAIINHTSK